jgi:polar amino acid transport system ATP-binding protein
MPDRTIRLRQIHAVALHKHEMTFARRVADHVVVLERGAIIEQGPPAQIFDAPLVGRTHEFLSHLGWAG